MKEIKRAKKCEPNGEQITKENEKKISKKRTTETKMEKQVKQKKQKTSFVLKEDKTRGNKGL